MDWGKQGMNASKISQTNLDHVCFSYTYIKHHVSQLAKKSIGQHIKNRSHKVIRQDTIQSPKVIGEDS